jgi:hypothetical protein
MVGLLFEVGPVMSGGMGAVQLTHGEIRAWMDNTGEALTAWEVRTLRRLSNDYLVAAQDAEKPSCKAPYLDPDEARKQRDAEINAKLDQFLG